MRFCTSTIGPPTSASTLQWVTNHEQQHLWKSFLHCYSEVFLVDYPARAYVLCERKNKCDNSLRTYELEVKVNMEEITAQPFPLTLVNGMYAYYMYTIFSQVNNTCSAAPTPPSSIHYDLRKYSNNLHINFGEKWMDKNRLSLKSLNEQGLYVSQTCKKQVVEEYVLKIKTAELRGLSWEDCHNSKWTNGLSIPLRK